ncbi:MAG: phosphoribosylglycinamide formyltransferase [Myxococcales bacterium]|nr:phosphoribosylglycinamide formyltransferase [Myxococcales bacterium]
MLIAPEFDPQPWTQPPARLGVLASGSGSNFAAIADAVAAGGMPYRIAGLVYNRRDAYAAERAAKRGIPAQLVSHRGRAREAFDAEVVAALRAMEVEWVAMAGWMRIATPVLLDAFPDRVLNLHPSLLPSFRGMRAVDQALEAGVKITGCTVHVVRPAVDDGPIVAQAAVPIAPGDTSEALHQRIHAAEHVLYPRAIAMAIAAAKTRAS